MDPVTLVVVPGFIGGAVMAVLFSWWQRRTRPPSMARSVRPEPLSTDVINMSSIKVAGVGGLGLVAMAAAVALDVPRIGQTVGLGLGLGIVVALVLIVRRRRREGGPMPSAGRGLGANTTLAIDRPPRADRPDGSRPNRIQTVVASGH